MTTAFASDLHIPDKDVSPMLADFLWHAYDKGWSLVLTEVFDYYGVPYHHLSGNEAYRALMANYDQAQECEDKEVTLLPGNHDWLLEHAVPGYSTRLVDGRPRRDVWKSPDGKVWVEHGHEACRVWGNMDGRKPAKRWAHDKLLGYGYHRDNHADRQLRWAKAIGRKIGGRGWKNDGTQRQIDYSRYVRERERAEFSIMGHTHEPLVHEDAGRTHFNTGAWPPLDHAWDVLGTGVHLKAGDIPSFFVLVEEPRLTMRYDMETAAVLVHQGLVVTFNQWTEDGPRKVWG